MEEFYPMPLFVTIEVKNIIASLEWYEHSLGFRTVYVTSPEPDEKPSLAHIRRNRYQDLLLVPSKSGLPNSPGQGVSINFLPGDDSVDAIAKKAIAAKSAKVEGPINRPWNVREITIYDPDGYCIRFSEPIDLTKTFKEVMGD